MSAEDRIDVAFRGRVGRFVLDAAFTAPARGVTALHGPSGCGKTTVLRCIAGLHRMADGHCRIGGQTWQDAAQFRPVHRRPIGYVFQEPSLFAHLSVRRNLLFGASGAGLAFAEVADLLGLARLLDRAPAHLSGGERQRVAIGRALLSDPRLLLMDEPLSALDGAAKQEILPFLENLHARLSLPVIYVSHDMREVERLADHLVLMRDGRVAASGPLAALQTDPALALSADREAAVSLDAVVESHDAGDGLATLRVAGGRLLVPSAPLAPGLRHRLRIQASDVSLTLDRPERSSILNILPVRILHATASGPHEIIAVLGLGAEGDGARLLARLTRRSWEMLALSEGCAVLAQVKGVALLTALPDA